MDDDTRKALLDRAEQLLPKYGGFVDGALNQACLLLNQPVRDVQDWRGMVAELDARWVAAQE